MTPKQVTVPILAAVLGGAITAAALMAAGETSSSQLSSAGLLTPGDRPLSAGEIYDRAAPGVVHVAADTVQAGSAAFDAGTGGELALASGSGFVLDTDGRVVTSAHVVTGVTDVRVTFWDGRTVSAHVIGKDEETDLAVLSVDPEQVDLRPLELGDSDAVSPGDKVIAMGNPSGYQPTAGTGRVAGAGRRIQAPGGYVIDDVLETDAVIQPATSGGPLLGPDGRVVGISTRLDADAAYAIPANAAREVLSALQEGEKIIRPYLGLSGQEVGDGVEVLHVHADGPAEAAGIRPGDVVEAIDGRPVFTVGGLLADAEQRRPGDTVTLGVLRNGSRGDVEVQLQERPTTLAAG